MNTNQYSEKTIEVSVGELDITPGPYCMSFTADLSKLERSIHQIGLICPPYVVKNEKGKLDIVSGYRRLKVLRHQGVKCFLCRDLSEKKMSGLELLLFNFYENYSVRVFNDLEKGMILKRLYSYLNKDDILDHYMGLLGLPAYEEILETYINLEDLETEHKEAIAAGSISMKSIRMINNIKIIDKSKILDILLMLKLNKNQQLHFIEYVQDLAVMKEISVGHMISEAGIQDILNQKDDNIPQKSRRVLGYLKSKRFPRLTEAENGLRAIINKLNLPPGSRIRSDPSFEDKDLCLEILFEDGAELLHKLKFLSNCNELDNIKQPQVESWERV